MESFGLALPCKGPTEESLRQTSFSGIISECPLMHAVFKTVEKVARTGSTVLVLGESGTGKELIARAIHKRSGRSGKLVPVNCGAIPEEILESELFGHEKGAFTGANCSKIGRFQLAEGGTIFLDEIGEMSPKLQVKLLRVLQERRLEPVGSTRSIDLDVRVVAATNKDLRQEVKAGRFREDLYYRLQVVPIELPPLRDRGHDKVLLARYFLNKMSLTLGRDTLRLSRDTELLLHQYSWPGNVRELENLIERLAVLSDDDELQIKDLPDYMTGHHNENSAELSQLHVPQNFRSIRPTEVIELDAPFPEFGVDFNAAIEALEVRLISNALERTQGNKKAAARLLGLNRTTLVEKIKKKGLQFCNSDEVEPG